MTPPVVIAGDNGSGPRIRVGRAAAAPVALEKEEGGVFFDGGTLALAAADDAGLQAAAEAYSARAPYQWRVPGEKLAAIADAVRAAAPGMQVELVGVTYQKGKADVHRAFSGAAGPSPPRHSKRRWRPRIWPPFTRWRSWAAPQL